MEVVKISVSKAQQKATKELLLEEGYAKAFESILFAVYTKDRNCIGEFEKNFE